MKNYILAILGGTIALFGLGYLIYVILGLHDLDGPQVEEIYIRLDLLPIIIMEALYATLLTIVFGKWTQIRSISSGAVAGLLFGLLIGACSRLEMFAQTDLVGLKGVLMAAITFGVRFAVAGGVIGLALGSNKGDNNG